MSQGKPRDSRKEQQWRRWIRQWQTSGLSIRAFCARHDLSQPSFYAWRRAIKQRDASTGTFVPVRVVPDGVPDVDPSSTTRLEVILSCGRRLRVPPGFDPVTLRQLLAVLEEAPPC